MLFRSVSDAGSRSTVQVNVDSESEEDSASMFETRVKQCFAPADPAPSEVAASSGSTMQLAFVADVTVPDPAKEAEANGAGMTAADKATLEPPPAPKKKANLEKGGHSGKDDALDESLKTPVDANAYAAYLETLRASVV